MIIEGYNVALKRITQNDIELIREWRNLEHVRKFMEYRDYITAEMQAGWFESVNNKNNLYFLIHNEGGKKGVINAKNIDWEKKTFEVGLFMGYEKETISVTPILATLCFFDAFILKLHFQKIFMKIHTDNLKAVHFDLSLGCKIKDNESSGEFNHYQLGYSDYLEKSAGLREKAKKYTGSRDVFITVNHEIVDSAEKLSSLL